MSLGALTLNISTHAQGPQFFDDVSLVGDGSYPTGGSLGLAAKLKTLKGDSRVIVNVTAYATGGRHVQYDAAADTLKVFLGATGVDTEVPNATDLSATTFKLVISSK